MNKIVPFPSAIYKNVAVQVSLWLTGRIAGGSQIYDSVVQRLVIENT